MNENIHRDTKLPYEPRHKKKKTVFGFCDQVRHKPACAAREARQRLEISDIETRGIILSRQRTTKVLISLRGSAPLLFTYGINRFSHDVAHMTTNRLILRGSQS